MDMVKDLVQHYQDLLQLHTDRRWPDKKGGGCASNETCQRKQQQNNNGCKKVLNEDSSAVTSGEKLNQTVVDVPGSTLHETQCNQEQIIADRLTPAEQSLRNSTTTAAMTKASATAIDHCVGEKSQTEEATKGSAAIESAVNSAFEKLERAKNKVLNDDDKRRTENPAYGYVRPRAAQPSSQATKPPLKPVVAAASTCCRSSSCCFDASCPVLVPQSSSRTTLYPMVTVNNCMTLPSIRGHRNVRNGPHIQHRHMMSASTLPRLFNKQNDLSRRDGSLSSTASSSSCCVQPLGTQKTQSVQKHLSKCDMIKKKARGAKYRRSTSVDSGGREGRSRSEPRSRIAEADKLLAVANHELEQQGGPTKSPGQQLLNTNEAISRLERASPSSPLELSFVVMCSARLQSLAEATTGETTAGTVVASDEDCHLAMGTLVTALYSRALASTAARTTSLLYVRTPHGLEGYVRAAACEPLSALPPPPSKHPPSPTKVTEGLHARHRSASSRSVCATISRRNKINEENKRINGSCGGCSNSNSSSSSTIIVAKCGQGKESIGSGGRAASCGFHSEPSLVLPEGNSSYCCTSTAGTAKGNSSSSGSKREARLTGCEELPTTRALIVDVDCNENHVRLNESKKREQIQQRKPQKSGSSSSSGAGFGGTAGNAHHNLLVVRSPCAQMLSNLSETCQDRKILSVVERGEIVSCDDEQLAMIDDELIKVRRRETGEVGYIPREWATKVAVL